jgi:hypothetical protein
MAYKETDLWNASFTVHVYVSHPLTSSRHWICPHSVCICYIWLSQQALTVSLNSMK